MTSNDKTSDRQWQVLQWAISELEKREKLKNRVDIRQNPNKPLQDKIVKLIGEKPLFDCKLSGVDSQVLMDTGSMISMVDLPWIEENLPDATILPLTDFLENTDVTFKAANDTDVPMVGVVVVDFTMGSCTLHVPFLVTSSHMSNPILGFNVMVHLITSGSQTREDVIDALVKSTKTIAANKISVMVTLVEQNFTDDDFLGDLRVVKGCVVPAKGTIRVRCKIKGNVRGLDLVFMCSEPVVGDWDSELEVTTSLGELKRGKTPFVNVELTNTSSSDKYLQKNMVVGEIVSVNAVIPLKMSLPQKNGVGIDTVGVEETPGVPVDSGGEKWQPKANLDHLTEEQRCEIEQLLYEECEVFARHDTDMVKSLSFKWISI